MRILSRIPESIDYWVCALSALRGLLESVLYCYAKISMILLIVNQRRLPRDLAITFPGV